MATNASSRKKAAKTRERENRVSICIPEAGQQASLHSRRRRDLFVNVRSSMNTRNFITLNAHRVVASISSGWRATRRRWWWWLSWRSGGSTWSSLLLLGSLLLVVLIVRNIVLIHVSDAKRAL